MTTPHKITYLDNAATTPMRPEAVAATLPFLSDRFGNPSGAHAAWQMDSSRPSAPATMVRELPVLTGSERPATASVNGRAGRAGQQPAHEPLASGR